MASLALAFSLQAMKAALGSAAVLAGLLVTVSAAAEPRVVVSAQGLALLCWEHERSLASVLGLWPPPLGSEAEASMWDEGRLVSVQRLVSVLPAFQLDPPSSVQVATRRGRVNLGDCDVRWADAAHVEPEGAARAVSFLPPATEPYRSSIRGALGVPSAQVQHLVRLDLDGDGVAEVVFAGSYASKPSAAMLDWFANTEQAPPEHSVTSFVGVSLASGGRRPSVRVLSRREDSPSANGMPGTYIAGVTDVSGDGTLELVVGFSGDHWAGHDFVRFARGSIHSTVSTDLYW